MIVPVYEAAPGAVVFRICVGEKWFNVISKSGGFGEADLLETLAGSMAGIREDIYAGQL